MAKLMDSRVEEIVKNTLRNDTRIDLSEIHVHVQDGVVYLSGMVDSAAERQAAREDLQTAPVEVERVVDDIKLRNYTNYTDAELREAVRKALIRDNEVDIRPISVEAHNGTITLVGKVNSYAQKSAAENVVWWTPGVTDVIDCLEVNGASEPFI